MPTQAISAGVPTTITQNVAYALPSPSCWMQSSAVVETSLDGSTWAAVSASTTGVQTAAVFVRCTTANALISVRRMN